MENGGRLAKALADGLGLPVGRLRELAEQGLLTTDVITRALDSQRDALQREAAALRRGKPAPPSPRDVAEVRLQ